MAIVHHDDGSLEIDGERYVWKTESVDAQGGRMQRLVPAGEGDDTSI